MIITYGDVSQFADMHWYMVELRSERTIESTLRRLGHSLAAIFCESPIEVFIPIAARGLGVFELTTANCLFVRSPNFRKLLRLKTITGVAGLVTLGGTNHPSKAIQVEDSFVQDNIRLAEVNFSNRAQTIGVDSFVRILDGDLRDWCGTVLDLYDGIAIVRIEVKTKVMLVETPVRNLLDMSHIPEHLRVFYYSELVGILDAEGLGGLVEEDIHCEDNAFNTEDGLAAPPPAKHGRQQTVTALVKRLITTGTHDPFMIGKKVLAALKDRSLRQPKNLAIVHGVIKGHLIEDYFRKVDPSVVNYHDVVRIFGLQYKFSVKDLARLESGAKAPVKKKPLKKAKKKTTRRAATKPLKKQIKKNKRPLKKAATTSKVFRKKAVKKKPITKKLGQLPMKWKIA